MCRLWRREGGRGNEVEVKVEVEQGKTKQIERGNK